MNHLRNQKGQATVEAVLAAVIIVAVAISVSKAMRDRGMFASLVEGPWSYIDGMAQHGVWNSERQARPFNPYTGRRVSGVSEPTP